MKLQLVNAQKMAEEYPETFEVPSDAALDRIEPGDFVKICCEPERFWVEVLNVEGEVFTGRIDNEPALPDAPWSLHDLVQFRRENIYTILPKPNEEE